MSDRTLGDPPTISVAVGITVGLIASFVQSAGLTLQRKSHLQNELIPEAQRKPETRRPLWLTGFTIFFLSNILGSVFQIASLPVVILAPLGAVSLLWNAFFARLLLGDVFTHYMFIGTILITLGAVLIAIYGLVPEPTHSLDDLLRLFQRSEFIVYFSLLGAALGIVLVITHITDMRLPNEALDSPILEPEEEPTNEPISTMTLSPTATTERTPLLPERGSLVQMDTKSITSIQRQEKRIARTKTLLAISYASASGILSGMCLLFAKSGVELLMLTLTGKNQFAKWQSWILVGGLIAFALLQLWYLHKSLILADPTLVCPLAFCFYNLSSIFNGLVYYDQFALLSTVHLLLVLLGIAILLGGVWAVSMQPGGSRRVEVGTWQEGAEVLTAEVLGEESTVAAAGAGVEVRVEAASRRGSLAGHIAAANRIRRRTEEGFSPHADEEEGISPLRGDTTTPFPSLRSPTLRSTGIGPGSGPRHSPTRNRRESRPYADLGYGHPVRSKWSRIFDGGEGTTTTGLSIGLSATSPGFALVPRRRVSSSAFSSGGGSGRDGNEGSGGGEVMGRSRRAVSESDAHWQGVDVHSANAASGTMGDSPPVATGDEGARSRKQWGWFKGVFNL